MNVAGPVLLMHMRQFPHKTESVHHQVAVITAFLVLPVLIFACFGNNQNRVIKYHELRGAQWESMNRIQEDFRKNVFRECLSQSKLSMNCSNCEYIYIDVIIVVDGKGRMCGYTKTAEKVCRDKAPAKLERCFMEYLESLTFPKNLRNMSMEIRLGTGLKC